MSRAGPEEPRPQEPRRLSTRPSSSTRSTRWWRAARPAPRKCSTPTTRAGAVRSSRSSWNTRTRALARRRRKSRFDIASTGGNALRFRPRRMTRGGQTCCPCSTCWPMPRTATAWRRWRGSSGSRQQQTQAAIEALMPAFSQGLKRNASDPYGVGALPQGDGERPARQVFRGRQPRLLAAGRRRGQRHSRPSVRLEGPVARGRQPGRAGDRHRPGHPQADAAGDRLDDHGRAVQAVDQPDAGGAASAAATIRSARSSSR